jgi:hypothetical protein
MAYKQNPGRGNNAKTGHGLPTPLKQVNPDSKLGKAVSTYAQKDREGYTATEVKMASNFAKGAEGTKTMPGTEMSSKTGQTTAKSYEKSLKSGKELGLKGAENDMFITDGGGKIMKRAEAKKAGAIESLKKEYASKKMATEDARSANVYSQNKRGVLGGGFSRPN